MNPRPIPAGQLAGFVRMQGQIMAAAAESLAALADAGGPSADAAYEALLTMAHAMRELGERPLVAGGPDA